MPRIRPHHRDTFWILGYLALVLVPAMLLGWFSLRAVENERAASRQRILDDHERYVTFASRIVHQELEALGDSWAALVPRAVGWEDRRAAMEQAVLRARGHAFIRESFLLHVSGGRLVPRGQEPLTLQAPDARQGQRFQELMAAGENAEFETNDLDAARATYEQLLREVQVPQLRAIAFAHLGRVAVAAGKDAEALRIYDHIILEYPRQWDLENRPMLLHAGLQRAAVLQRLGRSLESLEQLLTAYEWLLANSGAVGPLQFDLTREGLEARIERLRPSLPDPWPRDLAQRRQTLAQRQRSDPDAHYYAQKLSRKLARAWLDEQPYVTPVRYVSDATDGEPFLLAYAYLPDPSGTRITGLVGFQVDLQALAAELLPDLLQQVQLAETLHLAVIDDAGQDVLARTPAPESPTLARQVLAEPFGFWSVSVRSFAPGAAQEAADFRTTVLLYGVLLLLLTIVAGAVLVFLRLRREKQLSQQKTTFVSSVSHELRTPLTSIRMFAEMLEGLEDDAQSSERRRYLQTIRRECDRLQRLIESILDFTSLEQGTRSLQLEYEEIGSLVQAIAEDFRGQAEQGGFEYHVAVEPDLPELRIDADALRQVLLNLLTNAMKYSEDHRFIEVRAFATPEEVGIAVRDQGIGIAREEQEHIFEDFYRVDTRITASRSGLGLGLTLVRGLVQAHGGRISIDSQLHQGATFTVWLPRSSEALPVDPTSPQRMAPA